MGIEKLGPSLKKVDVLLLNLEEASLLTHIPENDEIGIMSELNKIHNGINPSLIPPNILLSFR